LSSQPATTPSVAWSLPAGVVAAAGCALLLVRPQLLRASSNPTATIVILFAALLAVGLAWPVAREPAVSVRTTVLVVGLGIVAFALGRLIGGGTAPTSPTTKIIALNTLAAVAEEAFFRRLVYGALASSGAALAVTGSALLFALVHLTVYGAWVLPIDLAAGLVLGWQRWATGSWRAPALTHATANLLVVI
jgi:membrane protease YdiL (CAAX protease family)